MPSSAPTFRPTPRAASTCTGAPAGSGALTDCALEVGDHGPYFRVSREPGWRSRPDGHRDGMNELVGRDTGRTGVTQFRDQRSLIFRHAPLAGSAPCVGEGGGRPVHPHHDERVGRVLAPSEGGRCAEGLLASRGNCVRRRCGVHRARGLENRHGGERCIRRRPEPYGETPMVLSSSFMDTPGLRQRQ